MGTKNNNIISILILFCVCISCENRYEPEILWEKIIDDSHGSHNIELKEYQDGFLYSNASRGMHGGARYFQYFDQNGRENWSISEGISYCDHFMCGVQWWVTEDNNLLILSKKDFAILKGAWLFHIPKFHPILSKYNSEGHKIWEKQYFEIIEPHDIFLLKNNPIITSTGDVYIVSNDGPFRKRENYKNVLILKINFSGITEWEKRFSFDENGIVEGILFSNGNIIIYGQEYGQNTQNKTWLKQFNSGGNLINENNYYEKIDEVIVNENGMIGKINTNENWPWIGRDAISHLLIINDKMEKIKKIEFNNPKRIFYSHDNKYFYAYDYDHKKKNTEISNNKLSKYDLNGIQIWEVSVDSFEAIINSPERIYTVHRNESEVEDKSSTVITSYNTLDGKIIYNKLLDAKMDQAIHTNDNGVILLMWKGTEFIIKKLNESGDILWEKKFNKIQKQNQNASGIITLKNNSYIIFTEISVRDIENKRDESLIWMLRLQDTAIPKLKQDDKTLTIKRKKPDYYETDYRTETFDIIRTDSGFYIKKRYSDIFYDEKTKKFDQNKYTVYQSDEDKIKNTITEYYNYIVQGLPRNAINLWSKNKIHKMNKNLIYTLSNETEYIKIINIDITEKSYDRCKTNVRVKQKKRYKEEECWESNIELVKEDKEWKIWTTPGKKIW